MIKISSVDFSKAIPANKEPSLWAGFASEFFPQYEINTNARIAGFLAQAGHESSDFNVHIENLNYSWDRLVAVFGRRYFPTDAIAKTYHRDPKKIANHVYNDANRVNKIGNTQPGDGWLFRGSGLIQLTGRWNMTSFGKSVNMTPEDAAIYARTKRGAFHSACWYWGVNNINRFCDSGDIKKMSTAVNGGNIGLTDRTKRWNVNKGLNFISTGEYPVISLWSRGDLVKKIQVSVGVPSKDCDGIYGNQTLSFVKAWQKLNNYTTNGRLDSAQIKKILGE